MTNLFDVLVQAGRNLDALIEGLATGGSTSTIADTFLTSLGYQDDHFNGGTAFLIRDAGGASAAPQGESRLVSDFANTGGVVTVTPVFSAEPAAGDNYGVMANRFPKYQLISKVNESLQEMGDIPTVDISSITTASADQEYAVPVAAKRDLRQVWIARSTAAPYRWEPIQQYTVEGAGANSVGNLLFPFQPPAGFLLKLVYMAPHPYVQADTDKISDFVGLDWLSLAASVKAATWRMQQAGADEEDLTALANNLMSREARARAWRRQAWPKSHPRLGWQESGALPYSTPSSVR